MNLYSDELLCPFTVSRKIKCPHKIDLDAAVEPPDWAEHPTAAYFMPTIRQPGEKPRYLFDPDGQHEAQLLALMRLSSPVLTGAWPIWAKPWPALTATNIGPLVLGGVDMSYILQAKQIADLGTHHNRRIVLITQQRLPFFGTMLPLEMDTVPDLTREPMEAIGAGVLRRAMNARVH